MTTDQSQPGFGIETVALQNVVSDPPWQPLFRETIAIRTDNFSSYPPVKSLLLCLESVYCKQNVLFMLTTFF